MFSRKLVRFTLPKNSPGAQPHGVASISKKLSQVQDEGRNNDRSNIFRGAVLLVTLVAVRVTDSHEALPGNNHCQKRGHRKWGYRAPKISFEDRSAEGTIQEMSMTVSVTARETRSLLKVLHMCL